MNPTAANVLIAGAGPSGLMLALELCRHGLRPRIIDPLPGPSPLSRALVMHARTLELLDRHGLAGTFIAQGDMVRGVALRRKGHVAAKLPLGRIGEGLSPFPYALTISQDQTERLLREALVPYGVAVEWNTSLTGLTQEAAGATATLQAPGQPPETVTAAYVAGCDGAHSAVRHALGIGFPGGTYEQVFFVADTVTEGLDEDVRLGRMLEVSLAPRTFNAFFPMPQGRMRIIGLLPDGLAPEAATFATVQPGLEAAEHVRVQSVSWFATYRVHHRVADHFRQGRAFLVGDAGHIHSPAGGQGMNTGLGDAVNLGWKLAAVLQHTAPEALLDTYEAERIPFARQLVATTDRAFTGATRATAWASFVRSWVAPLLLPLAVRVPAIRRLMFRTISQIGIKYPHSSLNRGRAGGVAGGRRLPWAAGRYEALRPVGWHLLHVGPVPAAQAWAAAHNLAATQIAPTATEAPGTVYVVRPDGYVGKVAAAFNEMEFAAYARQWLGQ
ncbi:FAD-dependent monooxygenase [Microvirga sp. STS02]|uniref:FAD-dependent monooxygenase n=1 Tax=Hymenobacter negativus TaxID=2795026 RepID=UPI0018DD6841|nr:MULTISPECIES: FAD-dependent monooxygenase [Bacteria]MBH8571271.1 FAD-dependent monooxygenase [Hymenobacter negativus]MBR7211009.1 FAD-dependent monooxygenase [Microvirga sp. STS02]